MSSRSQLGFRVRSVLARVSLVTALAVCLATGVRAQGLTQSQGPDFVTWSIGEIQAQLAATGGNGTYVWSVVGGSLPPGVSLRTDGPWWFSGSASAGLIGIATTPGTYHFTLRVTSGAVFVDQACTLKVTSLSISDYWELPDAFVGKPFTHTFSALNAAGGLTWNPNGALPPGMSVNTAGVLSGTPTAAGFYTVNFKVFDGVDTVFRSVNFRVNTIEITTPALLPNATQFSSYNAVLTAAGGSGGYTFALSNGNSLPTGLTMDSTGVISGTVTSGPGPWNTAVLVTDTNHVSYSKNMTIDVVGVPPTLPIVGTYRSSHCTFGVPCSRTISTFAGGTAPFTWTAVGLPPGMSIRFGSANTSYYVSPSAAEITGVPTATGTYDAQITVTDANGTTSKNTFSIRVSTLEQYSNLASGTMGVPYSGKVRIIGGREPYVASLISGQLQTGLAFDNNTFAISGTPVDNGGLNETIQVTDADGTTLETGFGVFVTGAPGTTIQVNNGGTITETQNQTFSFQLSACCVSSYTWSLISGALPPGVTLSQTGVLSGIANTLGTYTFLVKAADATNPADYGLRQLAIAVNPPVTLFVNSLSLPYANVNRPYNAIFTATGGTGALTWTLFPFNYLPPGLVLAPNGALSGTPTATGQYQFNVMVTDANGPVATRFFTISVYAPGVLPPPAQSQGPDFFTWSIGEIQAQLVATGGDGTYVWSVVAGSLPPGVSLRTDGPPWFSQSASAGLIGIATTPGTYHFTLRVTSGGAFVDRACTLKVTPLSISDYWDLPDAFVGKPYTHTFSAVNAAGGLTWNPNGALPPGMSINTAGVLSGTPTASGFYNVNFKVFDGVDTVFRSVNFRVNTIEITTPALLPNATQFSPYNAVVTATGGSGSYTFEMGFSSTLPSGLTMDSTGVISGTVTAGPGPRTFYVLVTDTNHVSYYKYMALDVVGVPPTLPYVSTYRPSHCTFGVPCSRTISTFSGGTAPFTWTAVGMPPGMSIRFGEGNTSYYVFPNAAEVVGVPTATGTYDAQITVTDADGATATNTFSIRVSTLEQYSNIPSGTLGVPYSAKVRIIGGREPYVASVISGQLLAGLAFDNNTFVISGIPVDNGNFGETILVTDADGATLETGFNVFVAGAPETTISVNNGGTITVNQNSTFSIQLSACCVPSYTWSLVSGAFPPGVILSPAGVVSGSASTLGTYTVLVKAADATNPANYGLRQITITVRQPVTSFFVNSVSLPYANVNTPYNAIVTATGGTGALTWALVPFNYLPPGLVLAQNGALSGTPTATGQYQFSVMVTDANGLVATGFFVISVYAPGVVPPLNLPLGPNLGTNVFSTRTFTLAATGGTPPYHYSLTPGAVEIPGMRVQDGPPLPTNFASTVTGAYLGVLTTSGSFNTSLRVTDSSGRTYDRPITMTVVPFSLLSQSSLPKPTVGVPYFFNLEANGGSGAYLWTLNSSSVMPPGLAINASGQISGTPTGAGNYFPSFTLTDLTTSTSISIGITLTVDPFAITTGGVLPQGTVGTPYSYQLDAPGCGSGCTWTTVSIAGLSSSSGGLISGTPTSTFNSFFTIQASGSNGTVQKVFSLILANPQASLGISTTAVGPTIIGGGVATALFAQGGMPPYAWSLQSGTLPTGITLQGPGETIASFGGPGFTYLAGRAIQIGVFNFTLAVTDANNTVVTRAFSWNITALSNQYSSLPLTGNPLVYSVPYTQPLLVIGGTGHYTWTNQAAMPPGLALSSAGVVSGTPTNTGFFSVPIQINDDGGNLTTASISFSIGSGTAFTISPGGFTSAVAQQGFSFSSSFSPSGGTAPYTITALTALPPGFELESGNSLPFVTTATAILAGMPLTAGTFSFTLRADDSAGNFGVRTSTITIAPFTLFTSALADASVGVAYTQPLLAWDNAGPVTWSVASTSAMPPGLGVSAGGVISGTPTSAGNYSFVLSVTDASGAVINFGFSLRISGIAIQDPSILPIVVAGTPFTYTFTAAGGGAVRVWSATNLPSGLTMSAAGTVSGTTTSVGQFGLFVTVTDGLTTVTKRFTVFSVNPNPNVLTFAAASTALTDASVGQSYSVTLNPNGGLPPYTWAPAVGAVLPPGLTLITGSQLVPSFTPGTTLLAGAPSAAGLYTFDLIVTDAAHTQVRRTFTLTVSAMTILSTGTRPATTGVAYADQFLAVGGTAPYTFSMTPVSLTQDMLPPGVTLGAGGLLAGTPTSTGNYAFLLRAQDAAGHAFSRRIGFTVSNAAGLQVTTLNPADTFVGIGRQIQSLTTNGTSTYTWSVVAGSLPPGVSLVTGVFGPGTTALAGAPTTAGTYTYTLRATDTANLASFAEHAFAFRVGPMQVVAPPLALLTVLDLPSGHVGDPYAFTLKVAGGTPPYAFVESPFNPLPAGLTLNPNTGAIAGTPQVIGSYAIVPIISDAAGHTVNSATMTLIITPNAVPAPLLRLSTALTDASLGVPYRFEMDTLLRGGTAPFTWTDPGAQLPLGLVLLPGSNGISTYLAGVPSALGNFNFSLTASDASGQTLITTFALSVSRLALTPDALSPGLVGTPYAVAFSPSGGVGPFTIQLLLGSDMPPGLSLNGGVLSGTPSDPGSFQVLVGVTDSVGNSVSKKYRITIDNAAGQAPALSLSPKPIQVYYELGSPAPAPVPVVVATTTGTVPFTVALAGIPGATLSANSGTTSATVNLTFNTNGIAAGTYIGLLAASAPQSANLADATPVTLTVAAPPPCTFAVNPTAGSAPSAVTPGSLGVATGGTCAWTAVASQPWLTITAGASGLGPGTIAYKTALNAAPNARNATITVTGPNGQAVYTLTQFGLACSYVVSPGTFAAGAAGGVAPIAITTSNASCTWAAQDFDGTIINGTGNTDPVLQPLNVHVPANPLAAARQLTTTIANKPVTVNQTGINCSVILSPYDASAPAGGTSGSVAVTTPAGCSYDTLLGPSWMSVTAGASGVGTGVGANPLLYKVDPNSTTVSRTGTLIIGGQTFQITQGPLPCSVTLDASSLGSPYGPAGGVGTIGIATNGANCAWTASSSVPWATVVPGSGTGNATVGITVTSNAASISSRSGSLTINGSAVNFSQDGTTCTFGLQSPNGAAPAAGGSGAVGVVAASACTWQATSNDAWLTITASGTAGSSDVQFVAAANTSALPRTGTLTIAGLPYTVTQPGAPCGYTLSTTNTTVAAAGVSDAFGFATTFSGCTPLAVSYANWISVTTGFNGASGTVAFTVLPNLSSTTRVGTIQVGDSTFTVTQTGGPCGYSLHAYGAVFTQFGGSATVLGSPSALGCTPVVGTTQPSIVTLGPLTGPVLNLFTLPYDVGAFSSLTSAVRVANITFGGQIFVVKQTSW